MRKDIKISSEFALIDVKKGRKALHKHFESRPKLGPCPDHLKIPVVIRGQIEGIYSDNDGVSREFSVEVTEAVLGDDPNEKLWRLCRDFIEKQEIGCAETISQTDRVIENAYDFIAGICDIVGYHKDEDE